MKLKHFYFTFSLGLLILATVLFYSCRGKTLTKGTMLATEVPGDLTYKNIPADDPCAYLSGSRIVAFVPGRGKPARVLTKDFYSACFPSISYDGRYMVFAGKKGKDDPWQIWEMNLKNSNIRKIIPSHDDCTYPAYLPDGHLVFTKQIVNDTVKKALCLFTCRPDGSELHQITFSPASNTSTTVLGDGRILTISRQLIPELGDQIFSVMRPDGTKADIFYRGIKGTFLPGRAIETAEGKIIFAEAETGNTGGDLVSISYNRPLHSRVNLTAGINGEFYYALPLKDNILLTSYRNSTSENFALYSFDPDEKSIGEIFLSDPGFNIIDVVASDEHQQQRRLPSEVDMGVKTGLLLCQDINFINPLSTTNGNNIREASKIEVLGVDTTYGVIPVENDGSFYLKVMADTPFRIRMLDKNNNIVSQPCSWLWMRPNERRGCVGCHDDPELVPFNEVPLAVRKDPVIVPVHITEIKEKIVELE
jgi:hypothetical protein